VMIIRSLS